MLSYRIEYDAFKRDFDRLISSASVLPADACVFVTDSTGSMRFHRGVEKYGVKYPCLLKCVQQKDRITCLNSLSKGRSGIYGCEFDGAEYIAVQACAGGRTKCAVVSLSEKNCDKPEDYLKKLDAGKSYLSDFSREYMFSEFQSEALEKFHQKITAITELINFSSCTGNISKVTTKFEYNTFIKRICKYLSAYSCGCEIDTSKGMAKEILVCKFEQSYPKALLYAIAFLLKNSKDRRLEISFEATWDSVILNFSTRYREGMYSSLYRQILEKLLADYDNETKIYIEDGKMMLTTEMAQYTKERLEMREPIEDVFADIESRIYSEEAEFAFKLVAGL